MKHAKTDYSQITNEIYVGTNFCCKAHFDKKLLNLGITTDISLEETRLDSPFGVVCYLWLPVNDHNAPTHYQFLVGISCIKNAVKTKNKVYIHCKNGHGRAPTLVAAYLTTQGMSVEEAIALIKSKRPEIHLEQSQLQAIKRFQQDYDQ